MSKKSTSEVGHAKNVANFNKMIEYCKSLGADYKPTNPLSKLENLETKYDESEVALYDVSVQKSPHTAAVNARQATFANLDFLASEIGYGITSMSEDERIFDDAQTLIRKIRGYASTPKTNDDQEGQETAEAYSNSQQSFDNLVNHFKSLIEIVKTIPEYVPEEDELKIAALETYWIELDKANKAVVVAYEPYSKAMQHRDFLLYDKKSGMLLMTKKVKSYIKQKYKLKSPQAERINSFKFKDLTKKKQKK